MSICLTRAAVWLPDGYEDAQHISEQSGIPVAVVAEKMGIVRKCRAAPEIHPSAMAIAAASKILEDIDPESIDMLIWTGSEYKDYLVWTAGIHVQRELGLRKAFAFDLGARCSTNVLALQVAKSMMESNANLKRVLLAGGHKTSELVNYKDPNSRFLYNLSDAGSAMLLEHGETNPILESSIITDGDFSLDVMLPVGGSVTPARHAFNSEQTYLQVPDIEGMRHRLADKSIQNFIQVIQQGAAASMARPIDYLALLHMKRSAHDAVLQNLNLRQDQSIYLDHYGHSGAPDQVLSLGLAEIENRLNPGDHVVMASAGIGYMWSAISICWHQPIFNQSSLIPIF